MANKKCPICNEDLFPLAVPPKNEIVVARFPVRSISSYDPNSLMIGGPGVDASSFVCKSCKFIAWFMTELVT